ncbi:hypothetical protein F5880DRAFT_1275426 [Lentinula raphanica]|nr:hypothetical protein F5880DRAFT_1275426 [Lentinula raphanica]
MKIFRSRFTLALIIASGAVLSVAALPLLPASPLDRAALSPGSITETLPLSGRDSEGCTKPLGEFADSAYRCHEDKCALDLKEVASSVDYVNIPKRGERERFDSMSKQQAQELLNHIDGFGPAYQGMIDRLLTTEQWTAAKNTFRRVKRDWKAFLGTDIGQSVINHQVA